MWIKSKYKDNTSVIQDNHIILMDKIDGLILSIKTVFSESPVYWVYKTTEERDKEYNWILSQLDCRVNDGKHKGIKGESYKYKYLVLEDLVDNTSAHPITMLFKGEKVYSNDDISQFKKDDLCIVYHKGLRMYCDSERLSDIPFNPEDNIK